MKKWSKEEIEYLRNNIHNTSYSDMSLVLNRSTSAISTRAYLEGLKRNRFKYDLKSGDKIHKFTVISRLPKRENSRHTFYKLKCECGNISEVSIDSLVTNNTRSCGCLIEKTQRSRLSKNPGATAYNMRYQRYKKRAEIKGIEFDFTKEDFINLSTKHCFYCGNEPAEHNPYKHKSQMHNDTKTRATVYTNGLDRIDSNKGYTKENCVPCCPMCNWMKNKFSLTAFIAQIYKIYNRLSTEEVKQVLEDLNFDEYLA